MPRLCNFCRKGPRHRNETRPRSPARRGGRSAHPRGPRLERGAKLSRRQAADRRRASGAGLSSAQGSDRSFGIARRRSGDRQLYRCPGLAGPSRGLALIVDETYRDFLPGDRAPHDLFRAPDWRDSLVQLYSFSKVFCLTGYRVGSIIAGPGLSESIAKAIDTIAICAPRIGQLAALYGLGHLGDWRRENTLLMRGRLEAVKRALARNDLG